MVLAGNRQGGATPHIGRHSQCRRSSSCTLIGSRTVTFSCYRLRDEIAWTRRYRGCVKSQSSEEGHQHDRNFNTVPRAKRPDAGTQPPFQEFLRLLSAGIRSLRSRYCIGWRHQSHNSCSIAKFLPTRFPLVEFVSRCHMIAPSGHLERKKSSC